MSAITRRLFITGTDTDVGKTYAAVELLKYFANQQLTTVGLKPVASGCQWHTDGWRNDDALQLQQHATFFLPYEWVNPFAFEFPIAPHIAAQLEQQSLTVSHIVKACAPALKQAADIGIIEGAGGWCLPLTHSETMADVVGAWGAAVILVVGMRLGCLNHALLTEQVILSDERVALVGWIANCVTESMPYLAENIATLQARMRSPYLGMIPYQQTAQFEGRLLTNIIDAHDRNFTGV